MTMQLKRNKPKVSLNQQWVKHGEKRRVLNSLKTDKLEPGELYKLDKEIENGKI